MSSGKVILNRPQKPYFFYGHRKPTQNRPTVRGGFFSNRQIPNNSSHPTAASQPHFDLEKWDPDEKLNQRLPFEKDPSEKFFLLAKKLSPIARYIVDAFRKHKHWNLELVADLNRLRRVTPKLVTEVLQFPYVDPRLSSKLFHWAGKQKGYRHDFACYNAFAYFLNRANHFRDADQVPELMRMQGKPPSEKQFEILIRMHADAGRGLRVYYVYEKMKKYAVKPRVFLYNRILDALVKTNHLNLAMSVYSDFKNEGLVEENVTFMILIKGLCKDGRIGDVLELLDQMRRNRCRPDIFAYTAMIKVLVSQGNLDGCLKVWDEMRRDHVEPDVMAYSTLIMALCKGNHVDKAYELFREMKVKKHMIGRVIYGSLIDAYVADGRIGLACAMLKDLMDDGYRADLTVYNSLISGLCKAGFVNKASKLFLEIVKQDLVPDFDTVDPILVSYAESKKMKEFDGVIEQMRRMKVSVINGLPKFFSCLVEKTNGVAMPLEIFEHLKKDNLVSVPIYNSLMDALLRKGEAMRALSLFRELSNSNLLPDSMTHSIAILCFVEAGDVQEACTCYNMMKEKSLMPSVPAYYSLAKATSKIAEIDAAVTLIHDCLANFDDSPIEFKYAIKIIHVSKSNDATRVVETVNEMVEQQCFPSCVTHAAIIYGMCKHGTMEEAKKVFSEMRELGLLRESDVIVLDEMLVEQMKKSAADMVLSGIKFFGLEKKLKAKGCTFLPS